MQKVNYTAVIMKYLWLTFAVALLVACGDGFFVSTTKQYYFVVKPATRENHRIFRGLFNDFNRRFNAPYLNLVREGALSASETSTIKLTHDLLRRDGKLGWGRWLRTSKLNSRRGFLKSPQKVRKDIYTMELEFDDNYLKKRYHSRNDKDQKQLRTLFLHELGHGFQMGHHPDKRSVMYREVGDGYKDYASFYERAYRFLLR